MSFYGKCYRNILWPAYERLQGRRTWILKRKAEQRQWWTSQQLAEFQFAELRNILGHANENCPWYRHHWLAQGISPSDIYNLDDFRRLPPLTKDDIYQHSEQMLATNYCDRVYSHNTGGSTGVPLKFYASRESYEWRLAVSMRGYSWAGCEDGDRQFYVWGQPIGTPPLKRRLKSKWHNAVLRRRVFSSFKFSKPGISDCVNQINAFRARTVVGYTNALCLLAQHILDSNTPVVYPRAIITAAEGVNSVQRELIQRAFSAPVFASYGSREFMLIAMECEHHHGLHLSADNLLVEVVNPDGTPTGEGEIGEILVTDLHNYAMPFIRYRIGDMGVLTKQTCPCGRGLPMLERVEGRVLDVIRTPDGRIVPGEFFPHLMKEFTAVRKFQVVQKELNRLQIKLVLQPSEYQEQLQTMQTEIRRVLGSNLIVEIECVSEIPLTASGKFRVIISEIAT